MRTDKQRSAPARPVYNSDSIYDTDNFNLWAGNDDVA